MRFLSETHIPKLSESFGYKQDDYSPFRCQTKENRQATFLEGGYLEGQETHRGPAPLSDYHQP